MSQIAEIKDRAEIVEIIAERLQLQKAGTYYKAPCPFHSEKTPSFFVSDSMQRYKCFGCGKSGDVIQFLQDYEGMSFYEALKYLADRVGITLESFQPSSEDNQRQQLLEVLNLAKEYYHYLLTEHKLGQLARDYLKERGVSQQSIKLFQLGYALGSWDGLLKFLHQKKKYSLKVLEQAGLVINRSGRAYDRFRSRIIFPLKNHRGQVVGFSGRILEKDAKTAKYINSPETALYHKKKMLYGYSELLQEIRKSNEAIIVEGEFDVISSAQNHVNNIVAIKGSALTEDHVKLLSRLVERVILSLDTDKAGIEATKRAIPIVQKQGLELRVLPLAQSATKAKDVDELIGQDPQAWRELAKTSISVYEFFLQTAFAQADPKQPEGKRQIIDQLAPVFSQIQHEVEKDFYLKKLAKMLEVKESLVREDISKFGKVKPSRVVKKPPSNKPIKLSRADRLERYLFFILSQAELSSKQIEKLQEFKSSSALGRILAAFLESKQKQLTNFVKILPADKQQLVFDAIFDPEFEQMRENLKIKEELVKIISAINLEQIKQKINQIQQELELLEGKKLTEKESQKQQDLLRQIVKLKQNRA